MPSNEPEAVERAEWWRPGNNIKKKKINNIRKATT